MTGSRLINYLSARKCVSYKSSKGARSRPVRKIPGGSLVRKDQSTTQCCHRQGIPSPYNTKAAAGVFRYIRILALFYTSFSTAAEVAIQTYKKGAAMGLGENGIRGFSTGKTGS